MKNENALFLIPFGTEQCVLKYLKLSLKTSNPKKDTKFFTTNEHLNIL